jgi:hypothetical protein
MQIILNNQVRELSRYNNSPADHLFADKDESILGHCILERGWDIERAIANIRPMSKHEAIHTARAVSWCKFSAVSSFVVAIVGATSTGGLGLLPLAGAALSAYVWQSAAACVPRRELEYAVLRECPQMPETMLACFRRGASALSIVAAWDRLLDNFADSEGATAQDIVLEFARILDQLGQVPTALAPSETAGTHTQLEPISAATPGASLAGKVDQALPTTPQALIARLRSECPALLKLIKSHPIRLVGIQQTGKTTLVKRLCLLRMILLQGHSVVATTPHYKAGDDYPSVFAVAGITPDRRRDYPAIAREWQRMSEGVESCQHQNKSYIFDEFGILDRAVEEEEIRLTLTRALRETLKFGIYPIIVIHGETAAFMPGAKGLVSVLLNSTVRVETIGEPITDSIGLESVKPSGKFTVTWLDNSIENGTIPQWLSDEYLIGLLGIESQNQQQSSAISQNEQSTYTAMELENSGTESAQTSSIESHILQCLKSKSEGATPGRIRADKKQLKNVDPKDIEAYLYALCEEGQVRADGNTYHYNLPR